MRVVAGTRPATALTPSVVESREKSLQKEKMRKADVEILGRCQHLAHLVANFAAVNQLK